MSRRSLMTPWGALWAAGSLLALPLLLLLSPPGLLAGGPAVSAQIPQVAVLSSVLGSTLALLGLEESWWLLESAPPGRSQLAQLCGIASAAILGWLLVGLSAGFLFGSDAIPALGDLVLALFSIAQLTLLGALLLHLPALPKGTAAALLLFVVLVLPALLQGANSMLAGLAGLVDINLFAARDEEPLWARLLSLSGPIVFLGAALALLHIKRILPPTRP